MQTDFARTQKRGLMARILAADAINSSFARFLIVGAVAYVITQIGLLLFYDVLPVLPAKDTRVDFILFTHPDIRLLIASALAVEFAIVFKFFANEHWTFTGRERQGWFGARFVAFNISCLASAGITVAAVNVLTLAFGLNPYIANTIGTLLAFMVNYAVSAYIIWPHRQHADAATN